MLLGHLRVRRRGTAPPVTRYRNDTQTTEVLEDGAWLDSWSARHGLMTKKDDIETGEDHKGT